MDISQWLFYIKVFFVALVIMLILDVIWLGAVAKNFYAAELGNMGGNTGGMINVRWPVVVVIYLIMALGFVLFILPRIQTGSFSFPSFLWGAAFGLVVYSVYNLTNLATLPQYPLKVALADMTWGTFLYGITSLIMGYLAKFLA